MNVDGNGPSLKKKKKVEFYTPFALKMDAVFNYRALKIIWRG